MYNNVPLGQGQSQLYSILRQNNKIFDEKDVFSNDKSQYSHDHNVYHRKIGNNMNFLSGKVITNSKGYKKIRRKHRN